MIDKFFTVYDIAAQAYLEPFLCSTVEAAIRNFRAAVMTEGHQFAKFPEDYVLYIVGDWDRGRGIISGCEMVKVAMALDFTGGFGNQVEMLKEGTSDA